MSAITANKNRWGDPPLLVQGRLSPVAVIATALAIVMVLVAFLATLLAAAGPTSQSLGAVLLLLLIVQLPLAQLPVVMAYVVLCIYRPGSPDRGRGLAWAALGLSYAALIWHFALAAPAIPRFTYIALGLLAVGTMHLPVFAAESRFAKNAVATLVIAGTFLSLLFPWLHYSREEARRRVCGNNLRQIALQLHETRSASGLRELPSVSPWSAGDEASASSRLFQWITESTQPGSNIYTIPPDSRQGEVSPSSLQPFGGTGSALDAASP